MRVFERLESLSSVNSSISDQSWNLSLEPRPGVLQEPAHLQLLSTSLSKFASTSLLSISSEPHSGSIPTNSNLVPFQIPTSSAFSFNFRRAPRLLSIPTGSILVTFWFSISSELHPGFLSNRFIYQPDAFSDLLSSCEATIVQSLICCSITIKLIQPSHRLSHLKILNRWEPPEAHLKLIEFSCAPWSKCCWPLTTSASRPIRYTRWWYADEKHAGDKHAGGFVEFARLVS